MVIPRFFGDRSMTPWLFVLFWFLPIACSGTDKRDLPVPPAGLLRDTQRVERGAQLFSKHCARCHGGLAEGRTQRAARFNPPAPDFHEQRYRTALPGYLYLRIEQGRKPEPFRSAGSVMPAWGAYFEAETIWDLVAYLRYRAAPQGFEPPAQISTP